MPRSPPRSFPRPHPPLELFFAVLQLKLKTDKLPSKRCLRQATLFWKHSVRSLKCPPCVPKNDLKLNSQNLNRWRYNPSIARSRILWFYVKEPIWFLSASLIINKYSIHVKAKPNFQFYFGMVVIKNILLSQLQIYARFWQQDFFLKKSMFQNI